MVPPVIPLLFLLVAALSSSASAHPHETAEVVNAALPGTWYHNTDHPVHALFKRGDDGASYPAIGTPEWSAGFPEPGVPMPADGKGYPQVWIDALNAAVKAGKIPDLPQSTLDTKSGLPVYPNGLDPNGPVVCSATYKCRSKDTSEIWDAPDGVFGSSFDDGPLPSSFALYGFLKENKVSSTHFMIGGNIINNPDAFKMAAEDLKDDIAVHTWTHPYMTTLSNLQVLGELGWTMKLIHDSTGGRVPKYWRPPTGDSDERVLAIAREVFGLSTVLWNQDPRDWSIGEPGGATRAAVDADLHQWITTAPKSPGLVILEHELMNDTVGAFIQAFPLIAQNGWTFESVARMRGAPVYQNAADGAGDVTPMTVGGAAVQLPATSTSASSSSNANATQSAGTTAADAAPSGTGKTDASGADAGNGTASFASPALLVSVAAAAAALFALIV
ncbi:glycoside hydrolase/deacetylase [Daedaleopsis nitida]|nr:glycoside hydrolase/deacetylase [Daedaleopsis nitida]